MATFQPSGVNVNIRSTLEEGSARSGTTLNIDPIITLDGRRVTMSDIGDIGFAKLSQGTPSEEIISFTGITDNTTYYTLTGCTWGYNFYDTTGSVTANQKRHVAGAKFSIATDYHFLYTQLVNVDDAQTVSGKKTFSTVPASTSAPIDDNDLGNKAYIDATATGSATSNRIVVAGNAGETVAAGNLLYLDVTDGEWKLCDADTASSVENIVLGIAQGAGTDGAAITDGILTYGLDSNQTGLTNNTKYYASNTAGALSSSAGTTEVTIGVSRSTTTLFFDPRYDQTITEDQQDALAGNNGTPSSSNTFVTQTGLQRGQEIYAADAEVSDTYVITLSPVPTAYASGMTINFKANTANTGAATLNVNSLGAITIKKHHDQDLETGDIESGQIITVVYDGTNFQMQSQTAVAPLTTVTANEKLYLAKASGSPVRNTTTETAVATVTIPGGTLGTNQAVRLRIQSCSVSAYTTSQTFTVRFKYGSTTMLTLSDTDFDTASVGGIIEFILMADASTSAQFMTGLIQMHQSGYVSGGTNRAAFFHQSAGSATEDSTGDLDMVITVQHSYAHANSRFDWNMVVAEIIQS